MSKAWEFLLPESGKHQVFAERLGESDQRIFIDGVAQSNAAFWEGPDNSVIELRCHSPGVWQLLVNGFVVEDYMEGSRPHGDESVRSLKSRPDGSYMIAPQLDAAGLSSNIVQEFVFLAFGQKHGVQVALTVGDGGFQLVPTVAWEIVFDGNLAARHSCERGTNADVPFSVSLDGVGSMAAVLKITWATWATWSIPASYKYRLTFGGVDVPAFEGPQSPAGRIPLGFENMPVVLASESSAVPAVLVVGAEREYLVDNRRLRAPSPGMCYRLSKDVSHRNEKHVETWGSIVRGVAEEDGWVKVGEQYLPMLIDGLPVLTLLQAADTLEDSKGSLDVATEVAADEHSQSPGVDLDSLPQGVSFNRQTGQYQATIKSKTGRWVDLGEYSTAEEAYWMYLEAMPIHSPDKLLVPSIPQAGAS